MDQTNGADALPMMEQVSRWCQAPAGAERSFPFGEQVSVYKVGGKMFAMVSEDGPPDTITLKGDPGDNEVLRTEHGFIRPGYYMNKRHWITIDLDRNVPMDLVAELVTESYQLIAAKLTRKIRAELGIELPA